MEPVHTRNEIISMLEDGPTRIAAFIEGRSAAQLRAAPGPEDWSANEVLAHLRTCGDVWGGCIARILSESHPTIRAVNPRTWAEQTDYVELDFHVSLEAYRQQRAALLDQLRRLAPEDWTRAATVTGAGRTLERTVRSYAQWLATHERPHLKQLGRAVSGG